MLIKTDFWGLKELQHKGISTVWNWATYEKVLKETKILLLKLFLQAGHKVHFIASYGTNKCIFWPSSRSKIACDTEKTLILFVWLLTSLYSGIKLYTRKINFFLPSCTIYYFLLASRKVHFISPRGSIKFFYPRVIKIASVKFDGREKWSFNVYK